MRTIAVSLLGLGMTVGGCSDQSHPVERVPVAAPGHREAQFDYDRPKPLPDQARLYDRDLSPAPPFEDPPLVSQKTPEQGRFEAAYRGVGRPRIVVFVNRSLEGEIVAPNKPEREEIIDVERSGRTGRVSEYHDSTKVYLRRGQYDEAQAKALDYQAVENILTDFLACQGAVEIMSPTVARQRLTDEQVKDLQSGRPRMTREIAQQLDADVLVMVAAHPTRQTENGLEVRLVGEALNVKGGQQIARAVVDVIPPLDKTTINRYTRFVARKLMMDLTQSWSSPDAAPPRGAPAPTLAPEPAPAPAATPGATDPDKK